MTRAERDYYIRECDLQVLALNIQKAKATNEETKQSIEAAITEILRHKFDLINTPTED
jgi:hypothetical protein